MSFSVLPLSPHDHPLTAQQVVGGHPEIAFFQRTHAGWKTAKYSPVGPHRGANLGKLEIALGSPVIGWGVHMKDDGGTGAGSGSGHSGGFRPTKFCPLWCKQANMHHWEGLIGATWLPIGYHIPPLSPTITQQQPKVPRGYQRSPPKLRFFSQHMPA